MKDDSDYFAFINILKIISKTSCFKEWLKTHHEIENDELIFEGYKFFLLTSLNCLIDSIIFDNSLELEEDYIFYRARFVGIPVEEIPNTCEKIIFIKNIWSFNRQIRKSSNWMEIQNNLKHLDRLFVVFDNLYKTFKTPTKNIPKKEALIILTQFYTYIFLNDTSRGYPLGSILSPITELTKNEDYLKKAFKGYLYSLQYIWFNLLGENFKNSCVKNLHKASEIYPIDAKLKDFNLPRTGDNIKEINKVPEKSMMKISSKLTNFSKKMFKQLNGVDDRELKLKEWFALDNFFSKIQNEIIEPIENDLKVDLGNEPLLVLPNQIDKSIFKQFLSKGNLKEPEYLKKNDKKSRKKRLDCQMLWYPVNILDSQQFVMFNGVPAFISTLIGSVQLHKYYENDEKVLIRVFKHPVAKEKFDYSFGLFIELSSWIADYSGWLIFFKCATDYSGFGGSALAEAKSFIDKYVKDGVAEVKEIIVDKNLFKEYLTEKSISTAFDKIIQLTPFGKNEKLSISELQEKTENFMGDAKGKFFEYVFYKWITENGKYKDTKCDFYLKGEQIDCMATEENEINVFECKLDLHFDNLDGTIKQIKNKHKVLKDKYKCLVKPHVVIFNAISSERRTKFENSGIKVLDEFKNVIIKDRIFNNSRKEILSILNFEFKNLLAKNGKSAW